MSKVETLIAAAIGFAALVISPLAEAQVNDALNDFWLGVNENTNVTPPQAYQGQSGGYFTGGSLVYRAPQENLQPFTMNGPSVSAGCGGIDIFTGGFGFVDSDQLVGMLRSIASNAQGYAFQLALETVCPMCAEQMDKLNALAQDINSFNIESCEAAQLAVGGLWPRQRAASEMICQNVSATSGVFSDYVRSRHQCGGNAQSLNNSMPSTRDQSILDGNVAWEVIKEMPFFDSNDSDAIALGEFLMSLTGTVILQNTDDGNTGVALGQYKPGLGDSDQLLRALIEGGDIQGLRCYQYERCTVLLNRNITITPDQALGGRVYTHLESILNKIELRQPLSEQEVDFINSTSVPIYRILSVSHAQKGALAIADIPQLAEYIALDMTSDFIQGTLEEIVRQRTNTEYMSGEEVFDEWRDDIRAMLEAIEARRGTFATRYRLSQDIISNYRTIERVLDTQLQSRVAQQLQSASWVQ